MLSTDYQLIKATSGREALQRLEGDNIDLVLLDVMMPEIDGFEVCRRNKGSEPSGISL